MVAAGLPCPCPCPCPCPVGRSVGAAGWAAAGLCRGTLASRSRPRDGAEAAPEDRVRAVRFGAEWVRVISIATCLTTVTRGDLGDCCRREEGEARGGGRARWRFVQV